jgi:hypothetical protein
MLNASTTASSLQMGAENMVEKETKDPETGADESTESPIPFPTPERVEEEGEERDRQDETEEEDLPSQRPAVQLGRTR